MPFGVILSCGSGKVEARPLQLEESTSKIYDAKLHERLHIVEGPLSTAALESVELIFYEEIVASGANLVDSNMQPIADLRLLRGAKRRLGATAYAIMSTYPDVEVNTAHSLMTSEEAIVLFERT